MRGIRRRKEAPYSKLGHHHVNALLIDGLHRLTSDVPITVKTSKIPTNARGVAYSHKIDGFPLDSGDEPSGHMSSKTRCLGGGMSLFRVRDNSVLMGRRPTMNTRAEPDLDQSQRQDAYTNSILTRSSPRGGLGKYYRLPWAELHPLSCFGRTRSSPSKRRISAPRDQRKRGDDERI